MVRRGVSDEELDEGGRSIGAGERRMRALMSVPRKVRLGSQTGVSMMLISATTVGIAELRAGAAAMRANRNRSEEAQLRAALAAMGFEYGGDRLVRQDDFQRSRKPAESRSESPGSAGQRRGEPRGGRW